MWTESSLPTIDRSRAAWWAYVVALGAVLGYVVYSFVGTFVLGVFAYYAARPLYDRISAITDSDSVTAAATVLGFVLPILALLVYAGIHTATGLQSAMGSMPVPVRSLVQRFTGLHSLPKAQWQALSELVTSPPQSLGMGGSSSAFLGRLAGILGTVLNGLLHLLLALAMAFYLLRDDDRIAAWFHANVNDRESTVGQYAAAVDDDLRSLYFGNVLFVATMAVIAAVVYVGANRVAPSGLSVPMPFVLAVLTGVSSLIPIVVGKVVYVPVTGYLALSAFRTGANDFLFVGAFFVVCLVVLDLLPQGVLQPYITGRQLHPGLLLFAYVLGPIVWGWYGFFLLPLLVVLVIEVVRVTFTDLVHGDSLDPQVDAAESLGSSEPEMSGDGGTDARNDTRDEDAADDVSPDGER